MIAAIWTKPSDKKNSASLKNYADLNSTIYLKIVSKVNICKNETHGLGCHVLCDIATMADNLWLIKARKIFWRFSSGNMSVTLKIV